jgi:hypothetical protein
MCAFTASRLEKMESLSGEDPAGWQVIGVSGSITLQSVIQADLKLQPHSSACWAARLLSAFQGLRGCGSYVQAVQTGRASPMQEHNADSKHRMRGVWRDAELLDL